MVKPILFNTAMVRAILDGSKGATRRLVKPQPLFYTGRKYIFADNECPKKWECCGNIIETYQYQPGDILYVRETWNETTHGYNYKASPLGNSRDTYPWRPSIHMPKEAARIWLEVTNVRIERLQDITVHQIIAEGTPYDKECYAQWENGEAATHNAETYLRGCFRELWDSTVKSMDLGKYGWDANPWVWVIEFKRCEKPGGCV